MMLASYFSSAGCGPPNPPVNGSVGEWTSSRVGAQVTYSCDTHLVLVGETVATCSLPSLTWIPRSNDVICVLPPGTPAVLAMHIFSCAFISLCSSLTNIITR